MPALVDPVIRSQIDSALSNWRYTGYVTAKDLVLEWIANNLGGLTLKDVAHSLHNYCQSGGVIDQVPETRPEWNLHDYHYDFRLHFGPRFVYIETILLNDDPNDPTLHVVSMHDV